MKRNVITGMLVLVCSFLLIFAAGCAKDQGTVKSDTGLTQAQSSAEGTGEQSLQEQSLREKLMAEAAAFQDIYFNFDKYDLKPEARAMLEDLSNWLSEHADFEVTIEGHCDNRGTAVYNLALGERRAEAAKAYMANLGVAGDRITTISYGEELPADPRDCESAWAKNRRDHFIVFPKKQ